MRFIYVLIYRMACLLALASLVIGVAACGGQRTPVASTAPGEGAETSPTPQPGAGEVPNPIPQGVNEAEDQGDGPVVITFSGWEYDRSLYEPLMEKFNQLNPGIIVQFAALPEPQPGDETAMQDPYRMLASGGDTFILWGGIWGMVGPQTSYFRDLTPLIESDPAYQPDDFWPGTLEACMDLDGHSLGLPLSMNFNGLFYNQEAFDAAGLPRPAPGWTLGDFRKAVIALSKGAGEDTQYGFAEQSGILIQPYLNAALEENGGEIDFETLEPAVQWYFDLVQAKAIRPAPFYEEAVEVDWQQEWETWQRMFKSDHRPAIWPGNLAESLPGSESLYSPDDPYASAAFKIDGFAPYPVDETHSNENTTPAWVQCAGMSAGTLHPRESWAWLSFLTEQWLVRDKNNLWEIITPPARISVAEMGGFWDGLPADVATPVRYILEHAWFGTLYPESFSIASQAFQKAAAGKAEFAAAVDDLRAQIAATPSPTPNTTPVVVATPKPTLAVGIAVVEYYYGTWGEEMQAVQVAVDAFNKNHPDSLVNFRSQFNPTSDEDDYFTAIGKEFDCFTSYSPYWGGQSPEGLLSLNSLAEGEGGAFLQDFDQNMLESYRHEGELYGLPAVGQPTVMSYNADLLAKRGLQPPSNDWTFDDYIDLATKAASNSEADRSYGLIFGEWDDYLFAGRGVEWADLRSDPPVAKFTDPDFTNSLAWIDSLREQGVLFVQTNDNWMDLQSAMESGQIAFWNSNAGQPQGWNMAPDQIPSYKIGVVTMPTIDASDANINWSTNIGHFIARQSENVQLCWDWIKYLSEQPGAFRGVPARKSVADSPAWEATVGKENAAVYRLALSRVTPFKPDEQTTSPIAWPFYTWRREAVVALLAGEDYAALLPELQKKATDYLACMSLVDRSKVTNLELSEAVNRCAKQADPQGEWGP